MAVQREWFEKDYYKILGVQKSATDKEITKAYRKLAKQYHPDANPGSEDKFKEVSAAYEVLGDEAKRKEYDEAKDRGPIGHMAGDFTQNIRTEDITDLLGGLFNRGKSRGTGPQRGADQETEVHLSFEEAVSGVTTAVTVSGETACITCAGTGAAPGSVPVTCARCQGSGRVSDNQGFFSFSQPCPACGGRGVRIEKPCPTCGGTGSQTRTRKVNIRIPAGVESGQRIRIKGRGGPGKAGGPNGDLLVTVFVSGHKTFGRRGKDLTVSVPITFAEAALGATVSIPTLETPVSLKIPAGTKSGQTFRVRGRGVEASKKDPTPGDLLVSVEILVPKELDRDQIRALEQLQKALKQEPRKKLGGEWTA